jgi:hypothetical protein
VNTRAISEDGSSPSAALPPCVGCQAERNAGVVGHVEPVSDPLEHLQREHLPAAFEDLGDAALEDAGRGGDAVLARSGVLLGHAEDAGRVAVAEDLARLVAAPRPLQQVDRLER